MFVLFWGVFEEQSWRRMDEVWRIGLKGTHECAGYERRAFICDLCDQNWGNPIYPPTDHFLNVCFAIFVVKLHRNYNMQSVDKILRLTV